MLASGRQGIFRAPRMSDRLKPCKSIILSGIDVERETWHGWGNWKQTMFLGGSWEIVGSCGFHVPRRKGMTDVGVTMTMRGWSDSSQGLASRPHCPLCDHVSLSLSLSCDRLSCTTRGEALSVPNKQRPTPWQPPAPRLEVAASRRQPGLSVACGHPATALLTDAYIHAACLSRYCRQIDR